MSTPPQPPEEKSAGPIPEDRTRDVRRPSLPARLPEAAARTQPPTAPSASRGSGPPADETVRLEKSPPDALPSPLDTLAGRTTDKLPQPSPVRQRTLAFGAPDLAAPAGGRPGPTAPGRSPELPSAGVPQPARAPSVPAVPPPGPGAPPAPGYEPGRAPTPRRWPWVVLVLLPILVIAVAGVLLFLLLDGA